MGRIIYSSRTVWMTEGHGRTLYCTIGHPRYIHIAYPYPNTEAHTFESVNHENGHKYIYIVYTIWTRCALVFAFVFCVLCLMLLGFKSPKCPRSSLGQKCESFSAFWLWRKSNPQPPKMKLIFECPCVWVGWFIRIYVSGDILSESWPQKANNKKPNNAMALRSSKHSKNLFVYGLLK